MFELCARVLDNASYLHSGLAGLGLQVVEPTRLADGPEVVTPVVPVVVGDDWKAALLWKALYDAGVIQGLPQQRGLPVIPDHHRHDGRHDLGSVREPGRLHDLQAQPREPAM